jgi:hypothetical protein
VFFHGTHLGSDLFGTARLDETGGLKRGYSRGIPGLETLLALMRQETNGLPTMPEGQRPPYSDDEPTKHLIDTLSGDAGNFSQTYVDLFSKAINRDLRRPIRCMRLLWSCEHHHAGRMAAAVELLDRLGALCAEQAFGPGDRILLQAHGQAGLVTALLSNLLAPVKSAVHDTVLKTLKAFLPSDALLRADALQSEGGPLNGAALDVVTFGTPVRYGWDTGGLGKLLHIVNHRPLRTDGKRWLAKLELPQITIEMPVAWGGDYVQQLAVAGTDALPATEAARAANQTLWEILEPWDGFERWLECARRAVRCQNDGLCLLVDYKDSTGSSNPRDHLYGHAAYTRMGAMLFNTGEIVRAFYAREPC